jgi:hypothetical protein
LRQSGFDFGCAEIVGGLLSFAVARRHGQLISVAEQQLGAPWALSEDQLSAIGGGSFLMDLPC